jgi:hypothetical protein
MAAAEERDQCLVDHRLLADDDLADRVTRRLGGAHGDFQSFVNRRGIGHMNSLAHLIAL